MKLYLAMLLTLTQRLALRRNILQAQTLTSLHDRTTSWNGLFSALKRLTKVRPVSAHLTLTALYLALLFGLHNTIPALINTSPDSPLTNITISIVRMQPPANLSA
jgi:hypothetical protein